MNVPKGYKAKTLAEAQKLQDQIAKEKAVDRVDGKIKR